GTGEHHMPCSADAATKRIPQVFGIVKNALVQISGVRAKCCELPGNGCNDLGMGMSYGHHVIVGVQVLVAGVVVEVYAVPADHFERRVVEEPVGWAKKAVPTVYKFAEFWVQVPTHGWVEGVVHLAACSSDCLCHGRLTPQDCQWLLR